MTVERVPRRPLPIPPSTTNGAPARGAPATTRSGEAASRVAAAPRDAPPLVDDVALGAVTGARAAKQPVAAASSSTHSARGVQLQAVQGRRADGRLSPADKKLLKDAAKELAQPTSTVDDALALRDLAGERGLASAVDRAVAANPRLKDALVVAGGDAFAPLETIRARRDMAHGAGVGARFDDALVAALRAVGTDEAAARAERGGVGDRYAAAASSGTAPAATATATATTTTTTTTTTTKAGAKPIRGVGSAQLLRELKDDGWVEVSQVGSHVQLKHPGKPGRTTVPHPKKDLPPGTVKSIRAQAGIE